MNRCYLPRCILTTRRCINQLCRWRLPLHGTNCSFSFAMLSLWLMLTEQRRLFICLYFYFHSINHSLVKMDVRKSFPLSQSIIMDIVSFVPTSYILEPEHSKTYSSVNCYRKVASTLFNCLLMVNTADKSQRFLNLPVEYYYSNTIIRRVSVIISYTHEIRLTRNENLARY